nr:divalent-cation tolerance protein CutA [Oceanococcus sp. HetDA_MAG_MS8]
METTQATSEAWVVWITAPPQQAEALARGIVEQSLAACVQQLPIQSTYRWQGRVCAEAEVLLLCKTMRRCYPQLEQYVLAHHPYETPQILATPLSAGLPSYLEWLQEQTKAP